MPVTSLGRAKPTKRCRGNRPKRVPGILCTKYIPTQADRVCRHTLDKGHFRPSFVFYLKSFTKSTTAGGHLALSGSWRAKSGLRTAEDTSVVAESNVSSVNFRSRRGEILRYMQRIRIAARVVLSSLFPISCCVWPAPD